jgi:uncharacterized protein YndB with AHSA1/START domain
MTAPETPRLGRVTLKGDNATIAFERRMPHPREVVWKAITEPRLLATWHLERARIVGRTGGSVEFWSGRARVTGTILVWDPPHVFEHEWNVEARPGLPPGKHGIIRWELTQEGDETLLTLTHSHLTPQTVLSFAPGVHALLDRLEAHLNKTSLPDWMRRSEELRRSYSR